MRIGIVGCGLNADKHIEFSSTYADAKIVGLVDKDLELARKKARDYTINGVFSHVKELVDRSGAEIIHIVTPPQTHYSLARDALENGCHTLIEKPMVLNAHQGRELYELAEQKGLKICSMHNHFFDPCMLQARQAIEQGLLGKIIHVESYYGLNPDIDAFRAYPRPNVLPWLYTLPGGVFQDFMPHPLYVLLDYTGKANNIEVIERSNGTFPQNISDELRILINGEKAPGTVVFSFTAKPYLHFVRVHGTKMAAHVNFDTMTTVFHATSNLPKAAQKATYNLSEAWQLTKKTISNMSAFARGKLKPYQGMQTLIHGFYDALKFNSEIPVTKEQALTVLETMDEIWSKITQTRLDFKPVRPNRSARKVRGKPRVLVTGGTGFLGESLVRRLRQEGYTVRVLVRKLSKIERVKELETEIFFGDVADKESLRESFEKVDIVVHAAAGTSGSREDSESATINGTKNVLDLCREFNVQKLVYISSCSVYGVSQYQKDQVVNESSALEKAPQKRGYYSLSKLEAEKMVTQAMDSGKMNIVTLRPGTIFGPGGDYFTPMMGFSLMDKMFMVIGNGTMELPLVYIDNLVDAIMLSIEKKEANGEIFNVVDPERFNKKEYMDKLIKKIRPGSFTFYLPYGLLYFITFVQEGVFKLLKRDPVLTRYRLESSQKNILYDSSKIMGLLGWKQRFDMNLAVQSYIEHFQNKI